MKLFYSHHKGLYRIYATVALCAALAETGFAFILGHLAESAASAETTAALVVALGSVAYLLLLTVVDWLRQYLNDAIAVDGTAFLKRQLVRSVLASALPADTDQLKAKENHRRLLTDAQMVADDYFSPVATLWYQGCTLTAGLIGTALISPFFLPPVALLCALALLLPRLSRHPLTRAQARMARERSRLVSYVSSMTRGLDSIASTRAPSGFEGLLIGQVARVLQADYHRSRARRTLSEMTWLTGMLIIVGVWALGSLAASWHWVVVPQVVALAQLMMQVAGPMQSIGNSYAQIVAGKQQYTQMAHYLTPSAASSRGLVVSGPVTLSVDNLTVTTEHATVLHNLTFTLPHGARLLITGPSGSGKTTLLRALAGLTPHTGTITLNHTPLTPTTQRATLITLATQNPTLIPTTLADNLPTHHTTNPHTLHTILGPLNHHNPTTPTTHLSGGETKRLHLTHALTHNPPILALDEITTGLDPTNAHTIITTLTHSTIPIILATIHDPPDTPTNLGFTHHLTITNHHTHLTTLKPGEP